MATSWLPPCGVKIDPARWVGGDALQDRAFFEAVLREGGQDALARIWNDAPRGSGARWTRWFCPGVPMHATGSCEAGGGGRRPHGFVGALGHLLNVLHPANLHDQIGVRLSTERGSSCRSSGRIRRTRPCTRWASQPLTLAFEGVDSWRRQMNRSLPQ